MERQQPRRKIYLAIVGAGRPAWPHKWFVALSAMVALTLRLIRICGYPYGGIDVDEKTVVRFAGWTAYFRQLAAEGIGVFAHQQRALNSGKPHHIGPLQ